MERYEEALKDFDLAIEIDPKSWAIASRGETYRLGVV
jgi:tetratricopeptide (TPR) repeat protein